MTFCDACGPTLLLAMQVKWPASFRVTLVKLRKLPCRRRFESDLWKLFGLYFNRSCEENQIRYQWCHTQLPLNLRDDDKYLTTFFIFHRLEAATNVVYRCPKCQIFWKWDQPEVFHRQFDSKVLKMPKKYKKVMSKGFSGPSLVLLHSSSIQICR